MKPTWDAALVSLGAKDKRASVTIPRELAQALHAAGYTRVRISLTDAGVLLTPYAGPARTADAPLIELPEWGSA